MGKKMKGYRTIVVMCLGFVYAWLASQGIAVPESDQAAITAGVISAIGIALRTVTTTPMGGDR